MATVKLTVVLERDEIEDSDGTIKALVCTGKVCGVRFIPLIVNEWNFDGDAIG